ncbi:zinc containing alcohol dehydrogenase superfamily [Acanthamoeba polyphaga moumouvirus]|uniref:Zn-dependent alcohol dehydrogenase n=2 Tax=Moumouvirus TaxID=3080801 RepID=L7RC95_9VIRU|nr:zinc containing alcohol dehydrogenase superfamily [Acanthamoeba polyphaga moumouvirus]AEX62931.1 putative zinc-type alcohol dehydrogenase-like protein [Moumouvirus Monve]AGC01846.1 Zn-dependent alcohol dehydrogenase [Acanthamoeba polyphaga moumouvirus]AQN68205.1 Zn-dependent alcohol dehydrogenase [Saudi moumouvirus]
MSNDSLNNRYKCEAEINKPIPATKENINKYTSQDNTNSITMTAFGYGTMDKNNPLELLVFKRRKPRKNELLVQILYTGICHSDWHGVVGEWESEYPLIPGHEIVARVLVIGSNVSKFNKGDIVAIGPIIDSCGFCVRCHQKYEQYCLNESTEVYGSKERLPDDIKPTGPITYGGYSNILTVKEKFVYRLPENLDIRACAPLMCAAATIYSPMRQMNIGPGSIIAVAGIGGLGHMAIKIGKALGAKVVAITHTEWKVSDSINNLGADDSILSTDFLKMSKYRGKFDIILDTIPTPHNLQPYFELLNFKGILWILGALFPTPLDMNDMAFKNCRLASSVIAGSDEIKEMLDLCSRHNITADVELISAKDINSTRQKLLESKVKYRYVIDMTSSMNDIGFN